MTNVIPRIGADYASCSTDDSLNKPIFWEPAAMQAAMLADADCRNVICTVPIIGHYEKVVLESALGALRQRHSLLRSHYKRFADGTLLVVTPSTCSWNLEEVSMLGAPASAQSAVIASLADALAWAPFDVYSGPLVRCRVVLLSGALTVLIVALHHSIADAFCIGIIRRELCLLLQLARSPQAAAPVPAAPEFREVTRARQEWLRTPEATAHVNYWRRVLYSSESLFRLPYDRKDKSNFACRRPDVSGGTSDATLRALRGIAVASSTTLAVVFYAILFVVLGAWGDEPDVASWVCHLGRYRPELMHVIGCFIDYWPLRIVAHHSETFSALVQRIRQAVVDATPHLSIPLQHILGSLPEGTVPGYPGIMVNFMPYARLLGDRAIAPTNLVREGRSLSERSPLGLIVNCQEFSEDLRWTIIYSSHIFEESTIAAFSSSLAMTAEIVCRSAEVALGDVQSALLLPP